MFPLEYNLKHNITPTTIKKDIREILEISSKKDLDKINKQIDKLSKPAKERIINDLTKQMKQAAKMLEFEYAATLRDKIEKLKKEL